MAHHFNEYFSSIADKLQSKIYHLGQDYSKYLINMNPHSFFIKPTNPIEIINVINKLNSNKASGPFSVQPDILQLIKNIIADPLSKLINSSFESGIYFDNLKISKNIPIFKEKGDILEKSNYGPISLLSNINKIVEKLMQQ